MDNKFDRKFYWEVKDFMNKPHVPVQNTKAPGIVDSVKSVLEQNKPFTQSSFSPNSTSINNVRQVIGNIENNVKNSTPECKAFTKNVVNHPFRSLNENTTTTTSKNLVFKGPTIVPDPVKIPYSPTPKLLPGPVQTKGLPQLVKSFLSKTPWGKWALLAAGAAGAYGVLKATEGETSPKPDWVKDQEKNANDQTDQTPPTLDAADSPKPQSLDDMIRQMRRAHSDTDIPTYRPATRDQESNFQQWKTAVSTKNKALRAAHEPLADEQEKVRDALRSKVDELQALRKENPDDPRIADLEKEKSELMRTGRKIYDARNPRSGSLERGLDTLRGIKQARWAEKLGQFKQTMQGVDFDSTNPQHQNIMRAQQFPGLHGGQAGTVIQTSKNILGAQNQSASSEMDTTTGRQTSSRTPSSPSKSNIGQVQFSDDTPDWVRRHAAKFGDESGREIEAMRLGVTSVLQGDPTRPMDTSLSAAEVARRGQLLDRDRKEWARQNQMTTSGRQTGIGTGKTASQPESTWDEVARKSVQGDSELASAPLVRRGGKVYAQTANGEVELSTGSMNTSQYADNAPTRDQMNKGKR